MSKSLLVMGESGSGKTTSLRNLDPSTTFFLNCDKKDLPWKGWRDQYNSAAKNYICTDQPSLVKSAMQHVNDDEQYQHIKTMVIDTLNGIMVAEEMRNINKSGFGKWSDLAAYIYDIVDYALVMRDDLTIIFLAHSETISDDNGMVFTRMKTNGRKLDKIVLESKFTTVLLAERKDGKYIFHTHADQSTVKTPLGSFEEDEIENDITKVLEALKEY